MLEADNIYFGDCNELIKQIPDKTIDLIVTDPPYLLSSHGGGNAAFSTKRKRYYKEIEHLSNGISLNILDDFIRILKKINIYIWCSKRQITGYIQYFLKLGCTFELIAWHKTNPIPTCNNKYLNDSEYCLFFREKGVKLYGSYETKKTFYLTGVNKDDKKIWNHPTIKPLFIIKNLIINSSLKGDIVFDPFSGSGTTALAALQLKREYIAFENNKRYFDLSIERLKSATIQTRLEGIDLLPC